jgi:hypothetical protein
MSDDVLQAQSALDRFKNAAYDLVVEGESYRSRLGRSSTRSWPRRPSPPSRNLPRLAVGSGVDLTRGRSTNSGSSDSIRDSRSTFPWSHPPANQAVP